LEGVGAARKRWLTRGALETKSKKKLLWETIEGKKSEGRPSAAGRCGELILKRESGS